MKRCLCVLLVMLLLCVPARAETIDENSVLVTVPGVQGMSVGAHAAVVMEAQTGRVLFAQNSDERLPFASTTKIMTALLALEQPQPDAVFEVDAQAIKVEGSSMGLLAGDKASLRTLAAGMLLSSGNDAANATAVRIAGSVPAFVEQMNVRARQMGLENTSFETPSGLDGANHYSTAHDLALLAREALRNDAFRDICGQYKLRVSYGNPPYDRWLTNHNKLLTYYDNTVGVKTGFTKKAGRCLVSAARSNGVELICVTLNCPDDWNTHENLYERYFPTLQVEDLAGKMPSLTLPVTGGDTPGVDAVSYAPAQVPVPVEGVDIVYQVKAQPFLYAPVTSGQPVGEVTVTMDGQAVSTYTLIAGQDVALLHPYEEEKPGFFDWLGGLFGR